MKLRVLMDNHTYIDQYYLGEPAACYYIEDGDLRILFDTGYSDAFIKNAEAMGIDLSRLTHIVLSHGHNDHTGGLAALAQKVNLSTVQLVAHPDCFAPRWVEGEKIGSPLSCEQVEQLCRFTPASAPLRLGNNCVFLGQIPRGNDFENQPVGFLDREEIDPDFVRDDSGLAFCTPSGVFLVTGCSHSGICNMARYAKQVTGCEQIAGILGGFHLFRVDERLQKTIQYLAGEHIPLLYPCHCVSLKAKAEMMKTLPVKEVGVNMQLEL